MHEIKKALNAFKKNNTEALVSITKMREHPYKCLRVKKNNWNFLVKKNKKIFRRQQYENKKFDLIPNEENIDIEKKQSQLSDNKKWLKKVYRDIVKSTHPDKFVNFTVANLKQKYLKIMEKVRNRKIMKIMNNDKF